MVPSIQLWEWKSCTDKKTEPIFKSRLYKLQRVQNILKVFKLYWGFFNRCYKQQTSGFHREERLSFWLMAPSFDCLAFYRQRQPETIMYYSYTHCAGWAWWQGQSWQPFLSVRQRASLQRRACERFILSDSAEGIQSLNMTVQNKTNTPAGLLCVPHFHW